MRHAVVAAFIALGIASVPACSAKGDRSIADTILARMRDAGATT